MRDYGVQKKNQEMSGLSGASRWKGIYLIIGLIVMAELVTVSGRGHIDYQSSFGPKERRKRQVGQTDAFSLLSSLSRPAAGPSSTVAPGGSASGKQLELGNNAFGGLIGGIFNQALSNFARPTQNGGVNIDLGALANPQTWTNFGGNNGATFQPANPPGGDVSFPGTRPNNFFPPGNPDFCRQRPNHRRCRPGGGPGNGQGRPTQAVNLPDELKGITWAQYIDSSSMLWLPYDMNVPGFIPGRAYYLGFGNPDFAYQTCFTPLRQTGRCRFVQHCARPEIIASLSSFLSYACPIGSDYMGVCCPDNTQPTVLTTQPPPPPPPTLAPVTTTAEPLTTTTIAAPPPTTVVATVPSTTVTTVKKGCGELMKQTTRIVGGVPADKGEWPWMAALLRDKTDQYCGGVLITDQHILTASHCVDNFKPEELTVRLGEYDFSQVSETRRDFAAETIYMHESYDRRTYKNDIALIKLKTKATFNDDIWPICLPPSNIVLEGQSAFVTGWGTTSYSGQSSDILLEVILPIWALADCQKSYTQPISEQQLCAGYKAGGKDSCQGDSGGPLMYQMSTGRWAVVGIVSWGIRCAEKDKPGVYTRVTSYSDWIKAKVLA